MCGCEWFAMWLLPAWAMLFVRWENIRAPQNGFRLSQPEKGTLAKTSVHPCRVTQLAPSRPCAPHSPSSWATAARFRPSALTTTSCGCRSWMDPPPSPKTPHMGCLFQVVPSREKKGCPFKTNQKEVPTKRRTHMAMNCNSREPPQVIGGHESSAK